MYLRIANEIINTDSIVTAQVSPATPASVDEYTGEEYRATLLRVEVVTTAVTSEYDDGGDYRTPNTVIRPYSFTLAGDEAEKFLAALPVYEPVTGED